MSRLRAFGLPDPFADLADAKKEIENMRNKNQELLALIKGLVRTQEPDIKPKIRRFIFNLKEKL